MRAPFVVALVVAVAASTLLGTAQEARAQELVAADGGALTIETCSVHATVEEGVALVDVDQTFRNDAGTQREGIWSIRLPESSVVHSLSMWMAGREKTGRVLEAGRARAVYDRIVRGNRDPALLEEIGWRRFRVSVFPIPPRDTVRVRLRYAFVVPDDLGVHSFEIPLPKNASAVDARVDIEAAGGLALCEARGAVPDARVQMREGGATLRWSRERAEGLRPLAVTFAPRRSGFSVSVLSHRDEGSAEGFFVARVVPHLEDVPDLPRDVVFVVDRSGSMEGAKMDQARKALLHGLGTLRKDDRFQVVSFSSDVRTLEGRLLPAHEANLARARAEAQALDASGGTNIGDALARARALREPASGRLFVVVFLTDGDATVGVTDADVLVRDWRAGGNDAQMRLFALGVGEDVKDFLLSRLAHGSRGAAEYVRRDDDLQTKLTGLFERVRTPLLTEPEIEVRGVPVRSVEPRPLPDVFRGGATVLSGRFVEGGTADVVLRGRQGSWPVEIHVPVAFPTKPVARPHVAQLWARARIDRLLEDLRSNPAGIGELRAEIVALGLAHQVVSPYTSFLVVEDGVQIPEERDTARVPDGPPAGSGGSAPTAGGPPAGGGSGGGWAYRGPGSEVPPDSRAPEDPPPPEGGAPTTPSGEEYGGTTSGGGDGGGGNPPPGGGGGGGGPTTGGKPRVKGPGYEDWTFWWSYQQDGALDMRDMIRDRQSTRVTGSGVNAFGQGASAGSILSATEARIQADVLPALRSLLAADPRTTDAGVQSAAALALARAGDAGSVAQLMQIASNDTRAYDRAVAERAALALGVMQRDTPEVRAFLAGLVGDTSRPGFVRPYAAVSLGLLGDRADAGRVVAPALLAALDRPEAGRDIRPAAILALGLLGNPDHAAALFTMVRTERSPGGTPLDDVEISHAISALGRIGTAGLPGPGEETAIADFLVALVTEKDRRRDVSDNALRSAAIALGQIGARSGDARLRSAIVAALTRAAADTDDPQELEFALAAIGRIGAARDAEPRLRNECIAALRRMLDGTRLSPTYAALALATIGRSMAAEGTPVPEELLKKPIRDKFADVKDARARGSFALASGLLRDSKAVPALRAVLLDKRADATLRGYAALALGIIGPDSGARADVHTVLMEEMDRGLRIQAATASALFADAAVVPDLLAILRDRQQGQYVLGSVAQALGRLGDERAIAPLVAIATNAKDYPNVTRALAVTALGQIAQRRGNGVLARVSSDVNYRDQTSFEMDLLSIL